MAKRYEEGDKVRIVNLDAIRFGHNHFSQGDITTVLHVDAGGRPYLESVKPGRRGDNLIIIEEEFHAIERIEEDAAKIDAILAKIDALRKEVEELRGAKPTASSIVQEAKAAVEDLTEKMQSYEQQHVGNFTFRSRNTVPEFHVNRKKGVVTALVKGARFPALYEKGFAKCSPEDEFNEDIGKAIALHRALGLPVPRKFTNQGGK